MRLLLFALFTIALPVSWGIAEFKAKPAVRRVIGLMALLWSFAVASFVGALQQLGADTFFSQASKDLLTASVEQGGSNRGRTARMVACGWCIPPQLRGSRVLPLDRGPCDRGDEATLDPGLPAEHFLFCPGRVVGT
jgi:hypothetical protein